MTQATYNENKDGNIAPSKDTVTGGSGKSGGKTPVQDDEDVFNI